MKFRFSKLPRHKAYNYTPRYWDPRKEELKETLDRVEKRKAGDIEGMQARVAHGFQSGHVNAANRDLSYRRHRVKHSNFRLLLVIIFLLFIGYVIVNVYLPDFLSALSN